jgi:hypothetical protein
VYWILPSLDPVQGSEDSEVVSLLEFTMIRRVSSFARMDLLVRWVSELSVMGYALPGAEYTVICYSQSHLQESYTKDKLKEPYSQL